MAELTNNIDGGWMIQPQTPCNLQQRVATGFAEAMEGIDGGKFTLLYTDPIV